MQILTEELIEKVAKRFGFKKQQLQDMLDGKTTMPNYLRNHLCTLTGTHLYQMPISIKYSQAADKALALFNIKQASLKEAWHNYVELKAEFAALAPTADKLHLAKQIEIAKENYHDLQREVENLAHEATK